MSLRWNTVFMVVSMLLTGCSFSSLPTSSPVTLVNLLEVSQSVPSALYDLEGYDNPYTSDPSNELSSFDARVHATIYLQDTTYTRTISDATRLSLSMNPGLLVINTNSDAEITLSGSFQGTVMVIAKARVKVVLDGVTIQGTRGPALNLQSTKRSYVVTTAGSENYLFDSATYSPFGDYDMKGTLFSEDKLILAGSGTLSISSRARHGIAVDDGLVIQSGTIIIFETGKDGIHVNDFVLMNGGTLEISAFSDGIQVERGSYIQNGGSVSIIANSDGIVAITSAQSPTLRKITDEVVAPQGTIAVYGGHLVVSESNEALKAYGVLHIYGGTLEVYGINDGMSALHGVAIAGGYVFTQAVIGDGLDSNGSLRFTGGVTIAIGGPAPEGGLDNDANGIEVQGGTFIGIGGVTSFTFDTMVSQGVVVMGAGTFNQPFVVRDQDNILLAFRSPQSYQTLVFSHPDLQVGPTYDMIRSADVSGSLEFHGFYYLPSLQNEIVHSTLVLPTLAYQHGGYLSPEWENRP